jgi:hypothetical protein
MDTLASLTASVDGAQVFGGIVEGPDLPSWGAVALKISTVSGFSKNVFGFLRATADSSFGFPESTVRPRSVFKLVPVAQIGIPPWQCA